MKKKTFLAGLFLFLAGTLISVAGTRSPANPLAAVALGGTVAVLGGLAALHAVRFF